MIYNRVLMPKQKAIALMKYLLAHLDRNGDHVRIFVIPKND